MTDIFKSYNKTLKEIIDIISNELPNEITMATLKRKYTAAVTTDRTLLLTETGKELFAFRDYVAEGRWDELINLNLNDDVDSIDDFDKKTIQHMITLLRKIWMNYDDDEKKHIKKLIKRLLSDYTKYLMSN